MDVTASLCKTLFQRYRIADNRKSVRRRPTITHSRASREQRAATRCVGVVESDATVPRVDRCPGVVSSPLLRFGVWLSLIGRSSGCGSSGTVPLLDLQLFQPLMDGHRRYRSWWTPGRVFLKQDTLQSIVGVRSSTPQRVFSTGNSSVGILIVGSARDDFRLPLRRVPIW